MFLQIKNQNFEVSFIFTFLAPFQIFRIQIKIIHYVHTFLNLPPSFTFSLQTPKFQSFVTFFTNPPRLPISSNIIFEIQIKVENFKVSIFLYLSFSSTYPRFASPFRQTIFPGSVKRCSRRHVAVLGPDRIIHSSIDEIVSRWLLLPPLCSIKLTVNRLWAGAEQPTSLSPVFHVRSLGWW